MKYFFAILFTLLLGAMIVHYAVGEDTFKYSGELQTEKTVIKTPNLSVPSFEPYYPGKIATAKKPEIKRTLIKVIGEVSAIYVQSGEKVKKGQKLITIKNPLFNDQLVMNQAAIDELDANSQELENNKQKVYDARSKLYSVQSDLESKLKELRSNKEKLKNKLNGLIRLKEQLAKIPKIPTLPNIPTKNQQTKAPVTIPGQIPNKMPDINKINAGIAQLKTIVAKIDAGISKIEQALGKMPEAKSKLSSASGELNDIQTLLGYQKGAFSAAANFSKSAKGYLTLRAPRSGTISAINVSRGDTVCANQPLLVVSDTDEMKVVIPLPEKDSKTIVKNEKTLLRADGVKRYFNGRVTFISSKIDLAPTTAISNEVHLTRTVNIEIEVKNQSNILKDGMPIDVKFGKD